MTAQTEHESPSCAQEPPDLVQLLTADGQRVSHPDYDVDLTPDELRGLYRDLVLVRRIDTEATALQRQGELGLWAGLLGQEAAQVGSGRALAPQDYVFPTYREHGVAWCRDVDPVTLLGLFRGVNLGGWDPEAQRFHLYTIVIGAQALHGVGYAMGLQRDGLVGSGDRTRDTAVIAYFGDGASAQGDVNEAMIFAGVYHAPVVFFCQNNQWAISAPTTLQSRAPLYKRAEGFGFPGLRVDGNDVLACYAVTKAALERARSGEGPSLIEAWTYRLAPHTTSDDPTRYRDAAEEDAWRRRDPIARLRTWLEATGVLDEEFVADVEAESQRLAEHVRRGCRALPEPDPDDMFAHVYRGPHPLLDAERAAAREYRASFEGSEEAR
ncbi:MAG: pyruvate dehydrogenase (acetyl-transferring) E1 component subunit alpha [Kineosporiaceae bacterium]